MSRAATQQSAILGVVVNHCGQFLSPDRVDKIVEELTAQTRSGPVAWAFAGPENPLPVIGCLQDIAAAAQVVLDQIDSAGNVPLAAAFDGRELSQLRAQIERAKALLR